MAHTLGPWAALDDHPKRACWEIRGDRKHVATVYRIRPENDGDAALIAAAPDMAATLTDTLAWVEHWQRDVAAGLKPTESSLAQVAETLRAIIRKTEGRA